MSSDPARESLKAAQQALRAGQPRQAGQIVHKLLEKEPDHARANFLLGVISREMGDVRGGITLLERAAANAPDDAEIRFTLANTLHADPRRIEDARREYERAIELAPQSVPAHAALAKVCEELNDLPAARAAADRALELAPHAAPAIMVRALVDRREGRLAEARAGFERLVVDDGGALLAKLPPITRATAINGYGATLEALGEHEAAAANFDRAHRARWACPDAQRVRPEQPLKIIADARRLVTPEHLAAWSRKDYADGLADPAFLVGFPRSGTTLTEQMLAAHPGIVTLDEDSPMGEVLSKLSARAAVGTYPTALPNIRDEFVGELRALYARGADRRLEERDGAPRGGRLLLDKLPLTIIHLAAVSRLFPRARVIVAIRDPRDACVSAFSQLMKPNNAMAHLRTIPSAASFYAEVMGYWLELRETLGIAWTESRYEDLVADPEAAARRLVEFLGLGWDDAVLRYRERLAGKAISTPSYEAVSRPVTDRSIGRWKKHAALFEPAGATLDPFLDAFGYER